MTSLTLREQRLVALLILLVLIAGTWLLLVAPMVGGFAAREAERQQLKATIERNERLIASIPRLRRRIELQQPDRAQMALAASSRDLAGDLLRQRLQRSFEATGASLSAVGPNDAPATWVGASAEGTVTLDQLVAILGTLQNQSPSLVVSGLSVVADKAFQDGKLDVMTVKIDVSVPYSKTA